MVQGIPDFIVIGAMKCGTTSLYRHLKSHPGVYMPAVKEPNFYVAERNWSKGFDWYRSLFDDAPAGALLGEASTNYAKGTTFTGVPERLRTHVPDVRLIYLIRDPIERIRSHYTHAVFHRGMHKPVEEAITPRSGFVRTSLYGAELQRYREYFPADQIQVLLTEDLRDEPAAVLRRIERFLGLEAYDYQHLDRHYHVSSNRRVNNRLGDTIERHERLSRLSSWAIPHQLQDRVLTKPAGPAADAVPQSAIDRIREVLAADRELLLQQADLDLQKWTSLETAANR